MLCAAADPAECLNDHIRPRLKDPRPAGTDSFKALGPCHADHNHSMSVSVSPDGARIVWNCFTCKTKLGKDKAQIATRNALIRDGVPARCLPQGRDDAEAQLESVRGILGGEGTPAYKVLRAMALLSGWDDLPGGGELESVAETCRIAASTAYSLRATAHR